MRLRKRNYLPTNPAVLIQMHGQRIRAVIGRGVSGERLNYTAEVECTGNSHDRTEHKLRLHTREGNVPKLLPTVFDAVDRRSLVHIVVIPWKPAINARNEVPSDIQRETTIQSGIMYFVFVNQSIGSLIMPSFMSQPFTYP